MILLTTFVPLIGDSMDYYDYSYEEYPGTPQGKQKMYADMEYLGDNGYRVHTFTPIYVDGNLEGYDVLFERKRERQ